MSLPWHDDGYSDDRRRKQKEQFSGIQGEFKSWQQLVNNSRTTFQSQLLELEEQFAVICSQPACRSVVVLYVMSWGDGW
jgi:hypothetical protein